MTRVIASVVLELLPLKGEKKKSSHTHKTGPRYLSGDLTTPLASLYGSLPPWYR